MKLVCGRFFEKSTQLSAYCYAIHVYFFPFTQPYRFRKDKTKQQKDVGAMYWWDRHLFFDQRSNIHREAYVAINIDFEYLIMMENKVKREKKENSMRGGHLAEYMWISPILYKSYRVESGEHWQATIDVSNQRLP